jgi:hypothetical protein
MRRIATIVLGVLAVLVGMGAIMSALAQVRDQGALPAAFIWSYTLGIFLVSATAAAGICSLAGTMRKAGQQV